MRVVILLFFFINTVAYSQEVKIMTYNIRLDYAGDGENRWDNRKEMLGKQVLFHEPDFLGVQEALPNQMHYLDSTFTVYSFIGTGREGGDKGEYSAIFYNDKKYKVLEQSTFWLSETPDKPSKGWDAAYNRICTYGLFQIIGTKQKLWVFNTHFDHVGKEARLKSAKLILQKIKELNKAGLPFVLMGDFNLEPDSEGIQLLSAGLADSKTAAAFTFGPEGTFNAFEFNKPVTRRIDYIFVPKGTHVTKYAVLSDNKDCRYPSDHLPVLIEIQP